MQITLYTINEERNIIGKTLNAPITLEGTLKKETSILTPTVSVNRNDSLLDKNYVYIPKFKRFYFITDIVIDGQFFHISCEVDVLETYKTEILNSEQVISRQESKFNLQLRDEKIQRYGKTFQVVKKIGSSPFNTEWRDERGLAFSSPDRFNFVLTVSNDE